MEKNFSPFGHATFNFVIGNAASKDVNLFFQWRNDSCECLIKLSHDCLDMSDIAVITGVFESRSQAMKNGRKGPIPNGWSDFRIGKGMHTRRVCILKVME